MDNINAKFQLYRLNFGGVIKKTNCNGTLLAPCSRLFRFRELYPKIKTGSRKGISYFEHTGFPKIICGITLSWLVVTDHENLVMAKIFCLAFFNKPAMEAEDIKNALTNILLSKLLQWNITVDELRQKVGQEILKIFNVEIIFYNSSTSQRSTVQQNMQTEFITQSPICYHLPMSEITFQKNGDFLEISSEDYNRSMMVDFSGSASLERIGLVTGFVPPTFQIQHGNTTNITFAVESHYSSLPIVNGKEKCSAQAAGYWPCVYAALKKNCNCTPTANLPMTPSPSPGFVECNLKSYNICNWRGLEPISCFTDPTVVLPSCESWSLNVAQSVAMNDIFPTNAGNFQKTLIRISISDFRYAQIQEQLSFTFQEFLAALGGILGIWLGLSFFSIVRILSFPTKFIFGFLLRRSNLKFSAYIDPKKNIKVKKTTQTRLFLTLEYLFDLKYDEIQRKINLQTLLIYAIMAPFLLIGLIETGTMCIALYQTFNIGKTSSAINFMNNETFTFPNSTICLPINITDFKFIEAKHKNGHDDPETDIFGYSDRETLLNSNWSHTILQLSFELLAFYEQIERIENFEELLHYPILANERNASYGYFQNWTATDSLDRRIRSFNITAEELKQKCGTELRKIVTIDVEHFNTTNGTRHTMELILINETTFISETTICYRLRLDELVSRRKMKDYRFLSTVNCCLIMNRIAHL